MRRIKKSYLCRSGLNTSIDKTANRNETMQNQNHGLLKQIILRCNNRKQVKGPFIKGMNR